MLLQIFDTTDKQFIGLRFDSEDNPILLTGGISINVERVEQHSGQYRFINSNYIIDAEVNHGQDHKQSAN